MQMRQAVFEPKYMAESIMQQKLYYKYHIDALTYSIDFLNGKFYSGGRKAAARLAPSQFPDTARWSGPEPRPGF